MVLVLGAISLVVLAFVVVIGGVYSFVQIFS